MLSKTEGRRSRGRQDEMIGWHHQHNGHEFEQTPRDGEGQRSLECCSPWGQRVGHDLATEQQPQSNKDLNKRMSRVKSGGGHSKAAIAQRPRFFLVHHPDCGSFLKVTHAPRWPLEPHTIMPILQAGGSG